MPKTQDILYAVVGAGDFALEKVRNAPKPETRQQTKKVYDDFIKRGRALSRRIENAAPTKRAVAQSRTARSQVKAAATSVGKAVRANTEATRSAVSKATKAS